MNVSELAKEWKETQLDSRVLPARLQDEYQFESCLKYTQEQQVYKLLRINDHTPFLLKVAQDEAAPILKTEYRFLFELDFPFLPNTMDCFEEVGRVYLLREYLSGETLYELVENQGALPSDKAVLLTLSVCQMLHCLHTRKPPLIHRDIKPQNILYSPQGTCYLLDVGSIRQYVPDKSQDTVVMLTQATAAPEQFGFWQSDMRTDVYAVGKLLYYLLTAHFSADEPDLSEVPKSLHHVLRKCLSFSPQKRYQSVASLEKVLCRWHRLHNWHPALLPLTGFILLGCGMAFGFLMGRLTAPILPAEMVLPANVPAETALPAETSTASVTFAEPKIEEAVRLILRKGSDEPISPKDLGMISEIYICGNEVYPDAQSHEQASYSHWIENEPMGTIRTLEDLLLMPNLATVVLDRQPIWDLEPFTKLPWLETLSLCRCLVRDIAPLARCPWLEELYLHGNPLRDLSPVSDFQKLKTLVIPQTRVTDISALQGMKLERLDTAHLEIEDYSVLETLSLRDFASVNLPESMLPSLSRMTRLENLSFFQGRYHDLRSLSTLPALRILNVTQCEIDDYSDMSGFPHLFYLNLSEQKIENLIPFLALAELEYLVLSDTIVEKISSLPQFTHLVELTVDENLAERIAQTFPGVEFPFQIIVN
ncbi:MAG: protein kinase [Clostridiales bacterium]|nr:protein kinase [Clostridiales bacterium]